MYMGIYAFFGIFGVAAIAVSCWYVSLIPTRDAMHN